MAGGGLVFTAATVARLLRRFCCDGRSMTDVTRTAAVTETPATTLTLTGMMSERAVGSLNRGQWEEGCDGWAKSDDGTSGAPTDTQSVSVRSVEAVGCVF
eukprot:GFKZ01012855.1.p1 GENE.GFKZ01012855.1~~GFKZ01012855.1.p1  ORF type:complete len:100 (+),score=7.04 GFKZ01012855.1:389-688(+)